MCSKLTRSFTKTEGLGCWAVPAATRVVCAHLGGAVDH